MSGVTHAQDDQARRVPQLPEMVDRLVARLDPLQIILFGSWARGDGRESSDIDLLLVLPTAPREDKIRLMVQALDALADLPVMKDIIVTDPDEIERRGLLQGSVLRPALREGRVVYERP